MLQPIIDSCLETERLNTDMKADEINNRDLKLSPSNSNGWEIMRLAIQMLRVRDHGSRSELVVASKLAATADEGEMEEAETPFEDDLHRRHTLPRSDY